MPLFCKERQRIAVYFSLSEFDCLQDGYAVVASDGPGEYPVITESRAGNDGVGVTVTPGTVAYVTTGGELFIFNLLSSI